MAVKQEEKLKKLLLIGGVLMLGIFLFTMRLMAWKKEISNLVTKNIALPTPVQKVQENFSRVWQGAKSSLGNQMEKVQAEADKELFEQGKLDELKKKIEIEVK